MSHAIEMINIKLEATRNQLKKGNLKPHQLKVGVEKSFNLISALRDEVVLAPLYKILNYTAEVFSFEVEELIGKKLNREKQIARSVYAVTCRSLGYDFKDIIKPLSAVDWNTAAILVESYEKRLNAAKAEVIYRRCAEKVFKKFKVDYQKNKENIK